MKNWIKLLISIAIPLGVGIVAGLFTATGIDSWYEAIKKPEWQPPSYVFGPVWTVLYIMMGIAFYLIWTTPAGKKLKRIAITLWCIQLIFNFFWSFIFFKQHQIDWALGEILVLWFFILLTTIYFFRISRAAGWLMIPYILWVSFASVLTWSIYQLNPGG